jgi:hypothetical protein
LAAGLLADLVVVFGNGFLLALDGVFFAMSFSSTVSRSLAE